jgi:uncharacterized lipoprotein YddW (UPF0748 family)
MRRILLTLLTVVLTLGAAAQELPLREFRGAWLHIVGNDGLKKMSQDEIRSWLTGTHDSLQMCGCNAVFFQVRPEADAFYISDIEPWTRYLTGTQGKAPEPLWDPLRFMIEQCHSRGMELHAWLNPYRVTLNSTESLVSSHIARRNPDIFKKYSGQVYFDPGEPASREHVLKVVRDIVSRYDVDGIHFDDYFYPYPVSGRSFPDDDTFAKYGRAQGFRNKADWRRNNTTLLIHETQQAVKEIKPWVRFGVSPFGIHRNYPESPEGSRTNGLSCYNELYADAPAWAQAGDVDYLAPQLYWKIGHRNADYETLVNWWNGQHLKGHLYIGQSIETFGEPDLRDPKTTQLARKMELSRVLPEVDGNVWWPGWSLADGTLGLADSLARRYQRAPALIPAYTDIDDVPPAPVSDIWASHGFVHWRVEPVEDPMQEPHFYIVRRFEMDEPADMQNPSHIVAVTRDTSYETVDDEYGPFYYIVTVVDRCWNESASSDEIVY